MPPQRSASWAGVVAPQLSQWRSSKTGSQGWLDSTMGTERVVRISASTSEPQCGQRKTPAGGFSAIGSFPMGFLARALAQRGRLVFPRQVEELEKALGLLGAGEHESAVEDEAGHAVDALAASQGVLGLGLLDSVAMGEEGRCIGNAGGSRDLGQRPMVADVASFGEIGGEDRVQHLVLQPVPRRQPQQPMRGERVGRVANALEMEIETLAGPDAGHRIMDPLGAVGCSELRLDVA